MSNASANSVRNPRDHRTTGLRDSGTTRLRDYETTGPKIQAEEKIQTAECAEYAQKWSAFARFVYSAVLWPFYFGGTAQFLATKCKKTAEGRGEMEEGRGKAANRRCEQRVLQRSEVGGQKSEVGGRRSENLLSPLFHLPSPLSGLSPVVRAPPLPAGFGCGFAALGNPWSIQRPTLRKHHGTTSRLDLSNC